MPIHGSIPMTLLKTLYVRDAYNGASNEDVFVATANTSRLGDIYMGGSGMDTVVYNGSISGVNVNLATGRGSGGFASGDLYNSIENVVGSNFGDWLEGNGSANVLMGLDGNDTIRGGNGDKLYGDNGNDMVVASVSGGGHALLDGGAGADVLAVATHGGSATITTGAGRDQVVVSVFNAEEFDIIVTDFQPYFESQRGFVTEAESMLGDRLKISFNDNFFNDIGSNLINNRLEVSGDDLIMHFTHAEVNGQITFQDIGTYMNLNDYAIRIDYDMFAIPLAV